MGFQLREEDYVYPPREQALQRVTELPWLKLNRTPLFTTER